MNLRYLRSKMVREERIADDADIWKRYYPQIIWPQRDSMITSAL
jgi:hypothetical protein